MPVIYNTSLLKHLSANLLQGALVPLPNFLLLVRFQLLVVKVLSCSFDVVVAELSVLLRLVGVVRKMAVDVSGPVWLAILQPGK